MDVLSSRVLLRPVDPEASVAFYRDVLGLAVYREFPGGTVFFLGGGFLEVSGHSEACSQGRGTNTKACSQGQGNNTEACSQGRGTDTAGPDIELWLQVRDLAATHRALVAAGVRVLREPRREPWGLDEMWVADPDGVRIAVVEVPPEHPLRGR